MNNGVWNAQLMTNVINVEYHFELKYGSIWLEGPCDMDGCIKLFQKIDPKVYHIETYIEGKEDTRYTHRDGKWTARLAKKKTPKSINVKVATNNGAKWSEVSV